MPPRELEESLATGLRKTLDSHGHSFHYAVLEHLKALREQGRSQWVFLVSEFPSTTEHQSSRVDFVLQCSGKELLLVGECKRPNASLANWCFVKAPYRVRGESSRQYVVEQLEKRDNQIRVRATPAEYVTNIYDLGFELRGQPDEEPNCSQRGAIEDAVTQVLTGMNGVVRFHAERGSALIERQVIRYLPVVFTTARLFTSDVPLSAASIENGLLPSSASTAVTRAPWVLLQYPQSPDISHGIPYPEVRQPDLAHALQLDYWRTVAFVSPDGIESFLDFAARSL